MRRRLGVGSYIVNLELVSLLQSVKKLEVIIVTRWTDREAFTSKGGSTGTARVLHPIRFQV